MLVVAIASLREVTKGHKGYILQNARVHYTTCRSNAINWFHSIRAV